jgi:hypothetical protein
MLETSLVFCTLLGPEGPGLTRLSGNGPLDLVVTSPWARRTGYRPYFENYTVDASILDMRRKSHITIGPAVSSAGSTHVISIF